MTAIRVFQFRDGFHLTTDGAWELKLGLEICCPVPSETSDDTSDVSWSSTPRLQGPYLFHLYFPWNSLISRIDFSPLSHAQTVVPVAYRPPSVVSTARVVKAECVRFVQDNLVQGIRGKTYSVTLHPKEECHCPSTATFYHILASKMFIVMSVKSEKEEKKLASLIRYKSRPRPKNEPEKGPQKVRLWGYSCTPIQYNRISFILGLQGIKQQT